MAQAARCEAAVVCFDIGKSMGTRSDKVFEAAKTAVTIMIKGKVSDFLITIRSFNTAISKITD